MNISQIGKNKREIEKKPNPPQDHSKTHLTLRSSLKSTKPVHISGNSFHQNLNTTIKFPDVSYVKNEEQNMHTIDRKRDLQERMNKAEKEKFESGIGLQKKKKTAIVSITIYNDDNEGQNTLPRKIPANSSNKIDFPGQTPYKNQKQAHFIKDLSQEKPPIIQQQHISANLQFQSCQRDSSDQKGPIKLEKQRKQDEVKDEHPVIKRRKMSVADRVVRDKSSQFASSSKSEAGVDIVENHSNVVARASSASVSHRSLRSSRQEKKMYPDIDQSSVVSAFVPMGKLKTRLLSNMSRQAHSELADNIPGLGMPVAPRNLSSYKFVYDAQGGQNEQNQRRRPYNFRSNQSISCYANPPAKAMLEYQRRNQHKFIQADKANQERKSSVVSRREMLKRGRTQQVEPKKKRELKILEKETADPDSILAANLEELQSLPRRSCRNKIGQQSIYTIDKLKFSAFQSHLAERERKKQEDRILQKTIQISLMNQTKHANKKDVINEPHQWFKNFLNEQSSFSHDLPDLMKDPNQKHSQNSKKTPEKGPSQSIKAEKKDELQDLIDGTIQKQKKTQEAEKKDDDFLEPYPVIRKRSAHKDQFEKRKELISGQKYDPQIVNPMDLNIRDHFSSIVQFVDFKNQETENQLYKPAQIQQIQKSQQEKKDQNMNENDIFEEDKSQSILSMANTAPSSEMNSQLQLTQQYITKDMSKGHFIRKKQTQCNVKRQCGVSYIKKTESKQLNVRNRGYEKLPPIVIQGSYTLPKNHYDPSLEPKVKNLIQDLFFTDQSNKYLVITAFESNNEIGMKNYLLKPYKRLQIAQGKFWIVRKNKQQKSILDELWMFIKDKYFVCVHFIYDQNQLLKTIDLPDLDKMTTTVKNNNIRAFIEKSDICLGILPKRGNASVKSMLKVYKLEDHYQQHMGTNHGFNQQDQSLDIKQSECSNFSLQKLINCSGAFIQGINTTAYLSRLELYCNEYHWTNASMRQKWALTLLINLLEDNIESVLLKWNYERTRIYQKQLNAVQNKFIKSIHFSNDDIQYSKSLKPQNKEDVKWEELAEEFIVEKTAKRGSCDTQSQQDLGEIEVLPIDPIDICSGLKKNLPIPITLINTRDCFAYDLKCVETKVNMGPGRENVIKREWMFDPSIDDGYPANYMQVMGLNKSSNMKDINNLKVGVTSYDNFFTHQELDELEKNIENTEAKSLNDGFLPMTAQKTYTGTNLKRTKFFFGFRYMWTKTQLQDPLANVAAGVRGDVSRPPLWMKNKLEEPLVNSGIVQKDFINSVALNVYHDGSEGLAQHFDDATRFKQPIFTLRLFSDSRLSFGSQYYGFQNSAFFAPLARGCILEMQEGNYAANGVKHCVRPCDMTGKSSAIILRQMHSNCISEATKLDRNIDLPMWMSSLSIDDKAVPYYKQREMECDWLEKQIVSGCGNSVNTVANRMEHKETMTRQMKLNEKYDSSEATATFGTYSPYKHTPNEQTQIHTRRVVKRLLQDIITRVEVKDAEENQIQDKISTMRSKLRSSSRHTVFSSTRSDSNEQTQKKGYETLQLFETHKVGGKM